MSRLIFILGETGTGKSTSLRNVNGDESYLINCVGKDLPFRKWSEKFNDEKKNYYETAKAGNIVKILEGIDNKRPEIKNIIIDDFQYMMSFEYLTQLDADIWEVFRGIGGNVFNVLNTARTLRKDLNVFILAHSDTTITEGIVKTKIKTVGKMVDEKITPEGLATIVLYTGVDPVPGGENNYYFVTQNDGRNTAKSPPEMFEAERVPNDLQLVIDSIRDYY